MGEMIINELSSRHIIFTEDMGDWELNIHLILGEKYNYLIDTGLGSLSTAPIKKYLEAETKQLLVINTHYHWDHIWGNNEFTESMIIAHRMTKELIMEKWEAMRAEKNMFSRGAVALNLPNLVFDGTLYFPEDQIRLFHSPGHTVDTISVLDEKEQILNVSDNIGDSVEELLPSLETENKDYAATIKMYQALDVRYCVSGHNKVLTPEVFDQILALL
ncbi:MBL fold metallo-hydrolase [Enterococcus larvae]|uniref:MBL fold metallo-hydrolase n=1 Tax=Enterococcus larvae TaxID=2794352 RepID=UPI003F31D4A6